MNSVRRALLFSLTERYLLLVLAFTSNILLARWLTPEQIGTYSVSLAVITMASVLREFGIGNFLIQHKNLTEQHVCTALGISIAVGSLLFGLTFFAANWVASFYDKPSMAVTLQICSLNFLLLPFCTISTSLLRREMQFKWVMYSSLSAGVVSFAATMGLALYGFGPDSMAVGSVLGNLTIGVTAWLARPQRRLLIPSLSAWRDLVSFGGQNTLTNVVTTISMSINDIAVGKIIGFGPVAYISRAQGLMNLFHRDLMSAVRNVAFPAFADSHRNQGNIEQQHVHAVSCITACAWPFYGFLALFSQASLRLLYGPQWDAATELVPWFCLAGAAASTGNLVTTVMTAVQRIDLVTRAELIIQPLRAALLVATVICFRTPIAFAIAFAVIFASSIPLLYHFKAKAIPNMGRELLCGFKRSLQVTLACLTAPMLIKVAGNHFGQDPVLLLAVSAPVCALCWVGALQWVGHPLSREPAFVHLMNKLGAILDFKKMSAHKTGS